MKDCLEYDGDKVVLKTTLPLPPSDNHIYFNLPGGGRGRTNKAKSYLSKVKSQIAQLAILNHVEFRQHVPYSIETWIYFNKIENKGWVKGKAKSRYMKVDTGNRTKLVEDSIAEAIGVDDSHLFDKYHHKRCDPDNPRVEVIFWEEEEL